MPRTAGEAFERLVDFNDLLDQRGVGVKAWVGGEHSRGVGEEDQQLGADEVGDEGGEPVVVAESDLVVGDGVVLVDDGNDAEVEQPGHRLAGVQVLGAVHEIERREQDLTGDQSVAGEHFVIDPHQATLADGSHGLEGREVAGAAHLESGQSGRDRTRRHHHHAVAGLACVGDLGAQLRHGGGVDGPALSGDR